MDSEYATKPIKKLEDRPCPKCAGDLFYQHSHFEWDGIIQDTGEWTSGEGENAVCAKCGAKLERHDEEPWKVLDDEEWNSANLPACPECGSHKLRLVRFDQADWIPLSGGDISQYASCDNCNARLGRLYMYRGAPWEVVDDTEWQNMMEAEGREGR